MDWSRAEADGWKPGKTLFDIEEACEKATIIMILVNDAAIKYVWPRIKPYHDRRQSSLFFTWFRLCL